MTAKWGSGLIEYTRPVHDRPSGLPWTIGSRDSVLLVHDMQHYFLDRFQPDAEPRTSLEANVATLVRSARSAGVPIVYSAQPGSMSPADRGLLADLWGKGMDAGPEHTGIPDDYGPRAEDLVITKWRYSAYHRSNLAEHLSGLSRSQIIICGVYAHVGILATALDAYSSGVQPFIVQDAVAAFDRETHAMAVDYLSDVAAVVTTTDEAVGSLASSAT